jgi:hypothetical protein
VDRVSCELGDAAKAGDAAIWLLRIKQSVQILKYHVLHTRAVEKRSPMDRHSSVVTLIPFSHLAILFTQMLVMITFTNDMRLWAG